MKRSHTGASFHRPDPLLAWRAVDRARHSKDLTMPNFDFSSWDEIVKLVAAFLFALPIAWERERSTRIMGVRTFPLVSLGSCAYVIVGMSMIEPGSDASVRLIQGLMAGVGFIGGGAILKQDREVHGTATAASVWVTGAMGEASASAALMLRW